MTLRRVLVALAITTLHQGKEYFGLTAIRGRVVVQFWLLYADIIGWG